MKQSRPDKEDQQPFGECRFKIYKAVKPRWFMIVHMRAPLFFYMLCFLRAGGTSSMSHNCHYVKSLEVLPKS